MKLWMIRVGALLLALVMMLGMIACKSEDVTPDEPTTPDTSDTPNGGDGGKKDVSVSDYDPSKTYTMPDFLSMNMADYITLGRYRGLTLNIDYASITVTDEQLDAEIQNLLYYHHPDCQRTVKWGDTVVTDYVGTLDGVAFSGGTAYEQTISLVDNSGYVPGFVEGLVGAIPGEPYAADVVFPENYYEELAGKAVVFTFTVHYIEGSPELDDAFVTDYTNGEYTSAEVYREALRDRMEAELLETAQHSALWAAIAENAAVKQYPADAVMAYYSDYYNYYSYYAAMYGMDLDSFLSLYGGATAEDIFAYCKQAIKEEMVYYAVFEAGEYTYTDEQYARALDLYTEANYATLEADMLAAGRDEFTVEEARDYFDRTYSKQIGAQCLEESAFNDLIATANVVIDGAPEEAPAEDEEVAAEDEEIVAEEETTEQEGDGSEESAS